MINKIVLVTKTKEGGKSIAKNLEEMTKANLFEFAYNYPNTTVAFLMPDVDVNKYIKLAIELSDVDIRQVKSELMLDKVTSITREILKNTLTTNKLEKVIYRIAEFIK